MPNVRKLLAACVVFAGLLSTVSHAQDDTPPETPPIDAPVDSGLTELSSGEFSATGKQPWEEYDKQIQASGAVGALGANLLGDQVNFYNNTLSFSATDVSVPGNNGLAVAITRS